MKNRHYYNNKYREALRNKINHLAIQVFSRGDLTDDHSNREQLRLNRALNMLMEEGAIIKIAHGLFAKSEAMTFPGGEVKTVLISPFETIAMEALNKLGVKWELGRAIRDYNAGKTTQVPSVFTVQLKSRFRGSIHAEGRRVIFEGGVNAR
ncbi:MAG: hypothetical protein NTW08_04870 [Gammaproteobacteria bacterium]|nr:hypothetical protein [Gammaproteobacteria bacterium]